MLPDPATPTDHFVTSSDLVRHFGVWQDRATRAPVYILNRGRPRLVLTSIETMNALCAPCGAAHGGIDGAITIDVLLDAVSDLVLVADGAGLIVAASRTARAHFGASAAIGAPLAAITPSTTREFLDEAIVRAMRSGVADRLDIPSVARLERVLTVTIEPAGQGVALFAQDNTIHHDHAHARAVDRALGAAMLAATGVAGATINPRGYVEHPAPALAALTGLSSEALTQLRFVALTEIAGRAALGTAIEAAMAGETRPPVEARLLVNRADPLAVRIGLAPLRRGAGVEGVAAVVVRQPSGALREDGRE